MYWIVFSASLGVYIEEFTVTGWPVTEVVVFWTVNIERYCEVTEYHKNEDALLEAIKKGEKEN